MKGAPSQARSTKTFFQDILYGFRRDPNARVVPHGLLRADDKGWDLEDGYEATARSPLARQLNARHLQMIAVGGAIGAGLFINTGALLAVAGPGSLFLAFVIAGTAIYCMSQALGEMAVIFPVAGSFSAYSTRFLDPAWDFAMGWNYAIQWLTLIPLENTAASIAVDFWTKGGIPTAIWITFGVRWYGEVDFVVTVIKLTAITGFVLFALVIDLAGGPQGHFIGGEYWHDPGAFVNGFKGFCTVIPTAALAYEGAELIGLCAAETQHPRQMIPRAVRQTFWRISFCYVISLLFVGLIVPNNDPSLLQKSTAIGDTGVSPFVIAIRRAGVHGVDSVFSAVIILSTFEVANSSVYASTRTLAALAEQRQAPHFLSYIDRHGRPVFAILMALVIGLLSYLGAPATSTQITVLQWFTSISSLAGIFTWASICLCHIRFRQAWKMQGHSLEKLAFRSSVGVAGSWYGLTMFVVALILRIVTAIVPIGYESLSAAQRTSSFFQSYLTAPLVLLFYGGYKCLYRTRVVHPGTMNLSIGILQLTLEHIREEEEAKRARP
ncbi:MAG: glyceraldehyde-3-phosphate dehydrogenase 1 [Thelocarpon superellum]|nr:MAG: glyceraldehyde-3-phosphate dehydrogenase 1 [Thelocarpon superellum]